MVRAKSRNRVGVVRTNQLKIEGKSRRIHGFFSEMKEMFLPNPCNFKRFFGVKIPLELGFQMMVVTLGSFLERVGVSKVGRFTSYRSGEIIPAGLKAQLSLPIYSLAIIKG